ncbi:MAG: HAMP domain-containing histidine kinase [Lachnospiraceae bacterium]|nr:HAMP domain-containing histidine kinase [Lachnospiraceae bacterium]
MDKTEVLFLGVLVLGVICCMLAVRLFQMKSQLRSFAQRIRKRKDREVTQPLNVELFDKDIVELAVALNEYTDEQKELLLRLERDREKLKYVIAGISHDFRTPLTAAYGYLQMVKKSGELSERSLEHLDISMEKTLYLKELSDEFFEMSALEADMGGVELTQVPVDKLLQECLLGQYEWIESRKLRTEFDIPEQSVCVLSNEHYLKRILENIFSNMKKYAREFVGVKLVAMDGCVEIIASNDTGCVEIEQEKVFEPFYRGKSRHLEGSGLGLYVVKCLAEAMGYEVHAALKGEIFEIRLRLK